jgi:PDZ domain
VNNPTENPVARSGPTPSPSSRPSLQPQKLLVPVIMQLSNTYGRLENTDPIDFVAATEAHIKLSVESTNNSEALMHLSVEAYIDGQRIVNSDASRRLQELAPLQISLIVSFSFQSTVSDWDAAEWVKDAFNSNSDRAAYIGRLEQRNSNFNTVTRVDVKVDGEIPNEEDTSNIVTPDADDQSQNGDTTLWIIVGASAGGFLLLLLLVVIISRRSKPRKASTISSGNKQSTERTSVDETTKMGYAAEINVDRQDDISTLGDPVYGGHVGGMFIDEMEQRDEYTASVGPDYDYSKHYLGASGSRSLGTATLSNELNSQSAHSRDRFASEGTSSTFFKAGLVPTDSGALDEFDDVSFEEQYNPRTRRGHSQDKFEVQVPPGKLGMVIDTPNNGVPVVHAIKQESILCDRVHVGDRLISVDGEDVTSMTAVQVSKLISLKSDQQRLLVFLRAKDMNSSDSSDLMIDS